MTENGNQFEFHFYWCTQAWNRKHTRLLKSQAACSLSMAFLCQVYWHQTVTEQTFNNSNHRLAMTWQYFLGRNSSNSREQQNQTSWFLLSILGICLLGYVLILYGEIRWWLYTQHIKVKNSLLPSINCAILLYRPDANSLLITKTINKSHMQ